MCSESTQNNVPFLLVTATYVAVAGRKYLIFIDRFFLEFYLRKANQELQIDIMCL